MRILQLTVYPTRIPRHGGQARVGSIRATLAAAGHTVQALAVYEPESYGGDAVDSDDIAFATNSAHRQCPLPFCTDYASGDFLAADPLAFERFVRVVKRFRPDVIALEQPWLLPAVMRLRREHPSHAFKLVYSSQNIEAPLKRDVLAGHPPAQVEAMAARIEARQREAAASADLTIACTQDDARVLGTFGASRVVVASNGIVRRRVDPQHLKDWKWLLGGKRFALFVGSAYPPNGVGFWEMYSPSLAFLAPDQRILAVGGVAGLLPQHAEYQRWKGINASRLDLAGIQSEEALAALLALASCIVLPITRGGGSNIKTAEAIYARKPVIGTGKSFRGYEFAVALPHVYRTDEPAEFRRLTKAALDDALPPAAVADDDALRDSVLWDATMAELPAEFARLGTQAAAGAVIK
jgi:hypothetical protein